MSLLTNYFAADATAVTPSDTTQVNFFGFVVGVAGDVAVKTAGGTTLTFKNWPVGQVCPVQCTIILATGTTATSIVGFKNQV